MVRDLDYLIVHTNASRKVYQDLAESDSAIETPIWAGLIHSALRAKGFGVGILDCEVLGLASEASVAKILEFRCRIAVFVVYGQQPSASSQNMSAATEVAEMLKEQDPEVFVIFVGGHVAALPRQTLEKHPAIDACCTNEGIRALCSLGKVNLAKDLRQLKGICFRDSAREIIMNEADSPIEQKELEVWMPGVDWEAVNPNVGYRTAGWHSWSNNSDKSHLLLSIPHLAVHTNVRFA